MGFAGAIVTWGITAGFTVKVAVLTSDPLVTVMVRGSDSVSASSLNSAVISVELTTTTLLTAKRVPDALTVVLVGSKLVPVPMMVTATLESFAPEAGERAMLPPAGVTVKVVLATSLPVVTVTGCAHRLPLYAPWVKSHCKEKWTLRAIARHSAAFWKKPAD